MAFYLYFFFISSIRGVVTCYNNLCEKRSRLEDAGYAVGARVLELLCHRDKVFTLLRVLLGTPVTVKNLLVMPILMQFLRHVL